MASSNEMDVGTILAKLGVPEEQAKIISNKMNGVDYLNLVNALDDVSPVGRKKAEQILSKYGIKLKVPQMENIRLESIFAGLRSGAQFDEAEASLTEHVRPISEMDSPIARLLEAGGFKSYVSVQSDADAEALIDWLEENEIEYQNSDKHTFLVRPSDREQTYRLNKFVAKCTGKTSVMDDEELEEASKMSKQKPSSRNPIAAGMARKTGGGAHNSKDPSRKDPHSRNAKHKRSFQEDVELVQGQPVSYRGAECPVHIPNGPNGTVGLLIDGKLKMVRESEIDRIDEGVLGMTRVDPLNRLKELAGVRAPAIDVHEDDVDVMDIDVADDFGDEVVDVDADLDGDVDVDVDSDFGDDDLDFDFGDDISIDTEIGGMPGDLPPMDDVVDVTVLATNSVAYDDILNSLNQVQATLGDVKLSEYKSILAKLDILSDQVRSMGRDYLGERRRK